MEFTRKAKLPLARLRREVYRKRFKRPGHPVRVKPLWKTHEGREP